ncbi:MAG: hypothetical protein JXB62_07760 [Pirellulales bacterium]|nr:hypothetical protein [Pirellulales bacterium]
MAAALLMLAAVLSQSAPDTAVVCPAEFRQALQPWIAYRQEQGHTLVLLPNTGSAEEIRQRIRDAAAGGRLRFVVLVGDAEQGVDQDPALRARCVPAHLAKAEVNVLWGSEPQIATDHYYADLDGDPAPEVAVGRLTADTPQELQQIVAKILAYERSNDFGPWRRRLNFVAGVGGFGPLADAVLESSARYFLSQGLPVEYRMSMTYGSWRSPYCPDPRLFHLTTLKSINEGCWFWVYIGHGFHLGLDRVRVPGGTYHILAVPDVPRLKCEHGAPIAMFLACYTGAFDATQDCLAERLVRQADGPVAAVAGSRVTMPYAMTVLFTSLMDECFVRRCPTLGEALLRAKCALMREPDPSDRRRAMLDSIAAAISPAPKKLAAERAEHLLLFNLIGDPLLRLRYPRPIELQAPPDVTAGGRLKLDGTSPLSGRGTIELIVGHGQLTFSPPSRREYPQTAGELAEFQETYDRANDHRLRSLELAVENGRFTAELEVPPEARGACHVRVFVQGENDFAMGAADVKVVRKTASAAAKERHY